MLGYEWVITPMQIMEVITNPCPSSSQTVFIEGVLQYIPRNMHTVFALLCFVVVIHWLIFPYPSGLLHSKATLMNMDKYFMWIHYERLHNHNKAKHKKKPCAYFLGYTVSYQQRCQWAMLRTKDVSISVYSKYTWDSHCRDLTKVTLSFKSPTNRLFDVLFI